MNTHHHSNGGFFSEMKTTNFLVTSLSTERIEVQSLISSRKRLLENMAGLLAQGLGDDVKEKDIYHLLLEREKLGNTGIGNGVAIPHSRCDFIDHAVVAIITLEEAVDYDSLDRQPVDVAFGLLVPKEANQEHLNLLADIAKLMSNQAHKEAIAQASSPAAIIDLIDQWVAE